MHIFATHLTIDAVNAKVIVLRILGCIIKTSVMDVLFVVNIKKVLRNLGSSNYAPEFLSNLVINQYSYH